MAGPLRIRIAPKAIFVALLASLAAAVLVVLAMALLGEYTKTRGRLLLTALSLGGFCLLALAPAALVQRDRYTLVGVAGMAAAALGFLLVSVGTWATPAPDAYWKSTGIVSVWAVSVAYLAWLLLLNPGRRLTRAAWRFAGAAAVLVPVLATAAIIGEITIPAFWWVVSVIVVLQIAAGLALPAMEVWGNPLPPWLRRSASRSQSAEEDQP